MEQNKMTPTPWVRGNSYWQSGEHYFINLWDEENCNTICRVGVADATVNSNEVEINASAIVSAINNTYGAGINPESVKDLYDALVGMLEPFSHIGGIGHEAKLKAMGAAKAAIEKAKL